MRRLGWTRIFLLVAILFLVLSIALSLVSLFPQSTGNNQKDTIIDNAFKLNPNETYKQGLGAFHGKENITVTVNCPAAINFSIAPANFTRLSNQNMSFTAGASYYEAVFYPNAANASWVHLQVTVEKPQVTLSFSWLMTPAKIMFLLSTIAAMIIIFKSTYSKFLDKSETKTPLPQLNKTFRNRLLALVLISLVVWLILLAINSSPLATFNNWYTDHARDDYVSSLFLKDGLSVFSQPLGVTRQPRQLTFHVCNLASNASFVPVRQHFFVFALWQPAAKWRGFSFSVQTRDCALPCFCSSLPLSFLEGFSEEKLEFILENSGALYRLCFAGNLRCRRHV